jgi:hypothetical protein
VVSSILYFHQIIVIVMKHSSRENSFDPIVAS